MSLVPVVLRGLMTTNAEALVLHVGERPHVLSDAGRIELSDKQLAREAVEALVDHLLPEEARRALQDVGAAQCELLDLPEFPGECFNVLAAHDAADLWIEVRRGFRQTNHEAANDDHQQTETANESGDDWPGPMFEIAAPPTYCRSSVDARAMSALDRLLNEARERKARAAYLSSGLRPALRVDGRVETLRATDVLLPKNVESLWRAFVAPGADGSGTAETSEFARTVPGLGNVRGLRFDDDRGPGVVLLVDRMRADLSPHLALPSPARQLVLESQGLVLLAGPPHASGLTTLRAACVELVNRTRQARIITVEREIAFVFDQKAAIISQRETVVDLEFLATVEASLREAPDVLVIEGAYDEVLMRVLLDASSTGRLIICSLPATDAVDALSKLIDLYPEDQQLDLQRRLAHVLRGVVAQVLIPRISGGRVAARELMLCTPAVEKAIAAGRLSQLRLLITNGREDRMTSLNEALVHLVEKRDIDPRDACVRSPDVVALAEALRKRGTD